MTDPYGYYGQDSPFWAYNQPGWKPTCVRCHRRIACKKFNSEELGTFAGEWICADDVRAGDVKTPAQRVLDGEPLSKPLDPEACPGCGCMPGDGTTEGCTHPDGCGYYNEIQSACQHTYEEQPGEPPVDVCTKCGHCRY